VKILAAAAPLAALFLSGCVNANLNRYSTDRAVFQDVSIQETANSSARCDLRLCVQEQMSHGTTPGPVQKIALGALAPHFTRVKMQPTFTTDDCDIALHYDSIMNGDKADLSSVHTGQFLARFETIFTRMGALVCKAVADGTELFDKIPGSAAEAFRAHRRAAPAPSYAYASAPAPAAAQGLSADDIARIAKAVQGSAPAAPAAASFPASPAPSFAADERPDDLAVIVGIETYSDIASKASYAERDATAFKAYVRALGVPERNIVLLTGSKAVRSALTKNVEGWLPRLAKADSRVYFYFSGHGAPDVKTGQAYLVPWDGDPNFLDATAYPVAQLYKKLGELPAKQVLVAMDSCFSGAGGRSVLASGARPLVGRIDTGAVPAKLTVLAASGGSEISGSLDAKGHGAFTYFLLEGLNAGKTTPKALNEYLTPRVQDEARRLNRDQTPQLQGDGAWSLR
jgi:hypothetical protein